MASLLLSLSSLQAQERASALGTYDFYHYFGYQELTDFLADITEAFPGLTHLESMAESQMGRQVWMLTVNNPETGEAEDKPGIFINQIHAGEVIASTSNLYTIWYLLENYGKDEQITDIVDHNAWYIVPRLDVDGAEAYLTGKPAGEDPNPTDNDGDFAFVLRRKDPSTEGVLTASATGQRALNGSPEVVVR
jgi:murein tripeptide amidase MpaA